MTCPVRIALLFGILSCGPGLADGENPALPDDPLSGRGLFQSKNCHGCHNIAESGAGIAPNLKEGQFRGSFLDIGAALWNHVPGMTLAFETARLPWPSLTQEEAVQLVSFLYFIEYLGRPGAASAGREVFHSRGCIECHTVDGGGAGVGTDFARLTQFASPLYIAQGIWNHGPAMLETLDEAGMEPPRFQEGDLANLSAFIRQKAAAGPREPGLLAPGNPNRGAALFTAKGCSHCHGPDGYGGEEGPNLGESDLHRPAEEIAGLMWNHALEMSATMAKLGIEWPQLTTAELADLVAFLYFLPFSDGPGEAERGSQVFRARGCLDCHAGDPALPYAGPNLSGRRFSSPALVATMWNHAPIVKEYTLNKGKRWSQLSGEDLRDLLAFFGVTEDINR